MILNFLRTVVFVVGLYYVLRFLVRVFSANRNPTRQNKTRETAPKPRTSSRYADREGEYVDYEEIKD